MVLIRKISIWGSQIPYPNTYNHSRGNWGGPKKFGRKWQLVCLCVALGSLHARTLTSTHVQTQLQIAVASSDPPYPLSLCMYPYLRKAAHLPVGAFPESSVTQEANAIVTIMMTMIIVMIVMIIMIIANCSAVPRSPARRGSAPLLGSLESILRTLWL